MLNKADLDNYITGHYGEDQFGAETEELTHSNLETVIDDITFDSSPCRVCNLDSDNCECFEVFEIVCSECGARLVNGICPDADYLGDIY